MANGPLRDVEIGYIMRCPLIMSSGDAPYQIAITSSPRLQTSRITCKLAMQTHAQTHRSPPLLNYAKKLKNHSCAHFAAIDLKSHLLMESMLEAKLQSCLSLL